MRRVFGGPAYFGDLATRATYLGTAPARQAGDADSDAVDSDAADSEAVDSDAAHSDSEHDGAHGAGDSEQHGQHSGGGDTATNNNAERRDVVLAFYSLLRQLGRGVLSGSSGGEPGSAQTRLLAEGVHRQLDQVMHLLVLRRVLQGGLDADGYVAYLPLAVLAVVGSVYADAGAELSLIHI